MRRWLSQHRAAFGLAVRRLAAAPFNTLLSLLVIGIALTLPAFGYLALDNLRELGRNASGAQQISVFVEVGAARKDVVEIENRLRGLSTVRFSFVPRDEALKRLQKSDEMAEIVASLPRNPLPDAFVVEPADTAPEALEALRAELASWPKVAHVQLDSAWVKRFDAFLRLGKLAVLLLAGLFGAGLVAVTFNTIRLQVMAQAAEIEVARMIGATDGFIRRPFVYFAVFQGVLAALIAWGLSAWLIASANPALAELATLYNDHATLRNLNADEVLVLLGGVALLAALGARLATGHILRQIEPQ